MKIIEYTNGQGHTDYAPESYLNQGAVTLMSTSQKDAAIMARAEKSAHTLTTVLWEK